MLFWKQYIQSYIHFLSKVFFMMKWPEGFFISCDELFSEFSMKAQELHQVKSFCCRYR